MIGFIHDGLMVGSVMKSKPNLYVSRPMSTLFKKSVKSIRKETNSKEQSILKSNPFVGRHLKKKRTMVPRVGETDHIPVNEVQTEGLFAGYKPLFLGNSSISTQNRFYDNELHLKLLPQLSDLKLLGANAENFITESSSLHDTLSQKNNIQDIIEELKNATIHSQDINSDGEGITKPTIPWDASISGMLYKDRPFKAVPNSVVTKLKPFKMITSKDLGKDKQQPDNVMIKLKVHNARINDDSEFFNLFDVSYAEKLKKQKRKMRNSKSFQKKSIKTAQIHDHSIKNLISNYPFLKKDQTIFKTEIEKLNSFLAKEFNRLTKLTIYSDVRETRLPLYIYVNNTLAARKAFNRYLKKRMMDEISPIYLTLRQIITSPKELISFDNNLSQRMHETVRDLKRSMPSVYYYNSGIDCIIQSSPVPGFKRIHWLKPTKRRHTFYGKNFDKSYLFNLNKECSVTRNGIRYMQYPINLISSDFDEVFSSWNYSSSKRTL
ncbi:Mrx6p NDAI_0A06110 [Naumovozyma dairenensis CBS 421]|uniref:Uncharacterized protein n=1 Tax=Naumovozyma dairenensis (strain ATCC 10597 / BCRC 20456 / CBS 421 / NBRC 0211 / NRRL Y-12639) TaxID=1071378 RepID=G0W4M8_NAUDC|nr:hypothetical protein NDAI_0A06110 [Naumovozyma dairenensis CBS 421]CCD22766.1 hypothetical protein NDAI_0A06110 [Naumovozyma dairenensis CBS 421]